MDEARATLAQLTPQIEAHFGRRLLGLYLFGSLAAGGFYPGRSDLDLVAVLASEVGEGHDLDALRALHERFEAAHPAWRNRIEVLYVGRTALATFATQPTGTVARISPGEPLHLRDLGGDIGWYLDWHSVVASGETIVGPPPRDLGPQLSTEAFRAAVRRQLLDWRTDVRDEDVAYFPGRQGYIAATVSRALYSLSTGEQTSKEQAIAWVAARHPEWADMLWDAYRAYRADVHEPHLRLIDFVDSAIAEAEGSPPADR